MEMTIPTHSYVTGSVQETTSQANKAPALYSAERFLELQFYKKQNFVCPRSALHNRTISFGCARVGTLYAQWNLEIYQLKGDL